MPPKKTLIYQAKVFTVNHLGIKSSQFKKYIGLTTTEFKTRYGTYKNSFKHIKRRHSTVLANYIWSLKKNDIDFCIEWDFVDFGTTYRGGRTRCDLCDKEKHQILMMDPRQAINKRRECFKRCIHKNNFLLSQFYPPDKD